MASGPPKRNDGEGSPGARLWPPRLWPPRVPLLPGALLHPRTPSANRSAAGPPRKHPQTPNGKPRGRAKGSPLCMAGRTTRRRAPHRGSVPSPRHARVNPAGGLTPAGWASAGPPGADPRPQPPLAKRTFLLSFPAPGGRPLCPLPASPPACRVPSPSPRSQTQTPALQGPLPCDRRLQGARH